ncbi:MAG: hypothetical protein Q9200_005060 [Gallowayella weberi]
MQDCNGDSVEMANSISPPSNAFKDSDSNQPQEPISIVEPMADPEPRSRLRMTGILLALYLSLFIAALDMTIVATAIPTISSQLNSASGYLWIGSAYLLANAAGAPLWAKLSDIWGRKPILLAAVTMFAGSSVVCAMAKSIKMLIIGRAFQGTAGGGLLQLVNIVISDIFSMRQRSLYLGFCEFVWALASGIGPVLGGILTQLVSWRWIWWVNLPCSALAFVLILLFLNVHNPKTALLDGVKAIDWFGSISIIGLTIMLLLGLNFGGTTFPWDSPKAVGQASPIRSGVLTLPFLLSQTVTGMASGFIIHRTGRYLELIRVGTLLMTIGFGLLIHLEAASSLGEIVTFQLVAGLGSGLLFSPPLIAIQANVSQDDTATATATFGFTLNLATSISVVVGGVIFQNGMHNHNTVLHAAGLPNDIVQKFIGGDAAANVMVISTIPNVAHRFAIQEAFASSLRDMWILYTCVAFMGFVASAFVEKRELSKDHVETKTGITPKPRPRTEMQT